jgi:hypothetical protein
MLIQIIKHTPLWVFILFFALLVMGYMQSKDRIISRGKITILPIAMIGLSFYGVVSAFGIGQPVSWVSWLAGMSIAGCLSVKFPSPLGVSYSTKDLSFSVPGSWLPFYLMMAIFSTKYTVGVILARQLPIVNEKSFIVSISLCYGLISGIFLFRALTIWRSRKCNNISSNQSLNADSGNSPAAG